VGFVGRAERIARVHQFGLPDQVMPGGPTYRYPARELLGITKDHESKIKNLILERLLRR